MRRQSLAEGSRARAPSVVELNIGQAVEVQGFRGIVRFNGTTKFGGGRWIGVELETPNGKNDGIVQGDRYFDCPPNHGLFVRMSQVKVLTSSSSGSALEAGGDGASSAASSAGRLRPSMGGGSGGAGTDGSKITRRSTMTPGRIASPSGLVSPGPSRIGGALPSQQQRIVAGQSGSPSLVGPGGIGQSRRISDVHGAAPRRMTLASSGIRSSSRQAMGSDGSGSVGTSRPESRAQFAAEGSRNLQTTVSGSPASGITPSSSSLSTKELAMADSRDPTIEEDNNANAMQVDEPNERMQYRPALNMDESSTFDSSSPAGPTLSEQTVSMKQYEELRLKYKFLEQKRSEDRQRIQEADKMRAEAEQALRVRDKLAAKVGSQQEEVRSLKQRIKQATSEREEIEARIADLTDSMEMQTVDKEMAEERAESLALENNALREQLDEISTSLDVYKQGGTGDSGVEDVQLQRQNERLKEALVRLRDVSAENEAQLSQRVRQLEREASAAGDLSEECERLRGRATAAEAQVEDLRERLDEALGAEEMISDLGARNLDLEQRVEELQGVVENLEALCEVNNEMEETRAEEEQGLRSEIERQRVMLADRARRAEKLEEAVAEAQFTIGQYRDLVTSLQGDIQRLRETTASQASQAAHLSSQTQEMLSLNLQLRSTAMRSRAAAVDLELRRLDAEQAAEQLRMTEPFVPDAFFASEATALRSVLAFRRLASKADILCRQLESDERAGTVSDDFVAAADVRSQMARISGASALVAGALASCSDAEFLRAGALLHDASTAERRIDGLLSLVREEEFRAIDALPEVRRLAAQAIAIADANVPKDAAAALRIEAQAASVAFGTDLQLANLVYVEQLLANADSEAAIEGGLPAAAASAVVNIRAIKAVALRLLRRARELREAGLVADASASEKLARVAQSSTELSEYAVRLRSVVQDTLAHEPARLQHALASVAQDALGARGDDAGLTPALAAIQRLTQDLNSALSSLETAAPGSSSEAPWTRRAVAFKAGLVQNADVERRTAALQEEIVSLARELKIRDQSLQESGVRAEMLEKRADTLRRQADQARELQGALDAARAKELTYEEAIEELQSEVEALEQECHKLRQATASAAAAAAASAKNAGSSGADLASIPNDLLGLRSKVATLHEAVAFLRRENAHLRAKHMFSADAQVLNAQQALLSLRSSGSAADSGVGEVVREARAIAKEACRLAAMPRLVRLSSPSETQAGQLSQAAPAWQPLRSRPQFDLYRQQTLAQSLKQRVESVQDRLRTISLTRLPLIN
ncbi:hypothetical protein GGF40_000814 [Coemansia sp. RSA 1286]|nr:hypothetical protein IWW45_001389 [Coemansia sp. RSA 485]KAJ2639456.1 hypothetical protein GGF40_000814 [Coemansia sp. RSA 1286]